jgi:tRNA uridine 5-carboxymethylaminomethyl modification enzyme
LGGLIHIGSKTVKAGRKNEPAAYGMTESLRRLGFEVGRLKTGTPPRLDGNTIDFNKCEIQPGMEPIPFFSVKSTRTRFDQTPCHLTHTTDETKAIISDNLKKSAMFSGKIKSTGPRYCPSIEDKIYRFSDKPRHQIFLEPEGNGTDEIYPNGFSTSLPEDIQFKAIRTVVGLEKAVITQPGYAIEYDYCPSYQIRSTLETKRVKNLYFAGQLNGTSGYEEAAGLGLMAAVNAVLKIESEPAFVLDRAESYIGVMIDDLITRSTTEPYRMFTSRAEYRLRLREDNARDRLVDYALKYGLITDEDYSKFKSIQNRTIETIEVLKRKSIPVEKLGNLSEYFVRKENISLFDLLKVPAVNFSDILPFLEGNSPDITDEFAERVVVAIKYEGYIRKQEREVEKFRQMESETIPEDLPYLELSGFRNEAREKFHKYRPASFGQASRIEGVTSGDIAALSIHLKKHKSLSKNKLNKKDDVK